MQITIEDISPVEKRVDFEVPWADVAPRLHTAYEKLRRRDLTIELKEKILTGGFLLLASLMALVIVMDLLKLRK